MIAVSFPIKKDIFDTYYMQIMQISLPSYNSGLQHAFMFAAQAPNGGSLFLCLLKKKGKFYKVCPKCKLQKITANHSD